MLFKMLVSYAVIAAAIATKNVAKMVEAVALVRTLVEKPKKHIIACVGAMDPQYGWIPNPFWDRMSDGMKKAIVFFAEKYGKENVMFLAPVAQGFCFEWLKIAHINGFDATVLIPSANYVGKPFKENGIFGTNAMKNLFSQIGNLLITEEKPKNNREFVKVAELLLIALSDEIVVFEHKDNPKPWVENIVQVATAAGVKVIKKDISPFLNLVAPTPEIEILKSPIKLNIKIGKPAGILSASEEIKRFIIEEGIQQPEPVPASETPIVSITQNGVTEAVEPPKKKRGRPSKKAAENESKKLKEQKLQEQFMALPG